ncbi:Bacterial type II/III secretion system short domain protein [Planctomycetes bacterium Poly30]|uniref:Bacterial type II/III secretion system short domain protein n=1 Tax=Saltatorellus ferox TaxID=2528018 RepID=A0A518EKT5_9BACT|nr:Bacterial type II/III secretion system short domain protein [Planctomycetes bacterium Poly30]
MIQHPLEQISPTNISLGLRRFRRPLRGIWSRALGLNPAEPRADDPRILSDDRTNSLILTATAERLADIKDLIAALDAK